MQGLMLQSAQKCTWVSVLFQGCAEEQERREGEIGMMEVRLSNGIQLRDHPWVKPGPMKERERQKCPFKLGRCKLFFFPL